jgi:predicted dehydrogenase
MNVGLIGCGRVAHIHMDAYRRIEKANVVAVSDVDLKRAKTFAGSYKIGKAFADYKDLLEMKNLDFVDVCTPTSTHASVVCDAAKFGHNVLVEKPMALNVSDCERMINESKKRGIKLCVCHNQLFIPSVRQMKLMADSEDYDLTCFRTSHRESFEFLKAHGLAQSWNVHPEHGGILWEVGCHLAYLQLHFLKGVKEVCAVGNKFKYPVYDEFTVLLRTSNQRYGIMEISWLAKEREIVYEICSSNGKRVQTYLPHTFLIDRSEDPPAGVVDALRSFYLDEKRIFRKWTKFVTNHILKRERPSHFYLINDYIASLEKDIAPPVTPEDGKNTINLLECIEKSLDEQRPVPISR